jgi:energy-coupling factor transporter ATP-binding protein EcfA2
MATSRISQITGILEKRRPLAIKVAEVESSLKTLALALQDLDKYRSQLLSKIDNLEGIGRLQEINLTAIQSSINEELNALGKLKNRFSRNTLNIGVIGRAGQGKSRLLQSLSGLSDEIPTGDRSHCTGVRSTIHHNPNVETYGEIWFHSERSFLNEVINPYYETLRLGVKPFALEEFAKNPLPPLHQDFAGQAEYGAMYEHFRKYHTNFDKYKHLLREASPHRISKEKIREYVAQDTPDGQRVFFNYLAVQEAKIVCSFPNTDVGQITLIDMPGLGDTGLGDAERLIQILGQDVDVALFVRMPRPPRDYWADVDVKLYDTARSALTDLPINLWSFVVLNRTDASSRMGDNLVYCEDLESSREASHIKVVDCITSNCADRQEANQKILDRVLDYLTLNITDLDRQYTSACQERLSRLQSAATIEIDKAKIALGHSTQKDSWFPVFVNLFDQLWEDLTVGLEGLLRELRWQRDAQDIDFKNQVNAAVQRCKEDTGIPSIENIKALRDKEAAYGIAYNKYLHEIRAHLSHHFLSLDDGLKQSLEGIKSQVVDILSKQGKLSALTDNQGSEFLSDIENILPVDLVGLKLGFNILASFNLSYRGLIQHRIRKHLDRLTPDDTTIHLSKSPSAQEILISLETLHAEALYECELALEELLCEPSQAAYAIVEEFVDRVLRAKDVKNEWLIFLQEVRSDVWSAEFEKLGENSRLRREWLTVVEQALSASQDHLIKL